MGAYKWGLTVVLGLMAVIVMSAPAGAGAVSVTGCAKYTAADGTRFDLTSNVTTLLVDPRGDGSNTCLTFPANSVVNLNGFLIVGPGQESGALGVELGGDSFFWGPGIVRGFSTCLFAGNHTAVENVLFNQCAGGIVAGDGYKIKEVRIHDCTPSSFSGFGMILSHGGFIESSIVRSCDFGVITGQNNKIWNLVVTRALFTGLSVLGGNAVSRTVISHPHSTSTIGLDYAGCAGAAVGCQDGSNSVSGHTPGLNVVLGTAQVVTQSTDVAANTATNCNGTSVGLRVPGTGLFVGGC